MFALATTKRASARTRAEDDSSFTSRRKVSDDTGSTESEYGSATKIASVDSRTLRSTAPAPTRASAGAGAAAGRRSTRASRPSITLNAMTVCPLKTENKCGTARRSGCPSGAETRCAPRRTSAACGVSPAGGGAIESTTNCMTNRSNLFEQTELRDVR